MRAVRSGARGPGAGLSLAAAPECRRASSPAPRRSLTWRVCLIASLPAFAPTGLCGRWPYRSGVWDPSGGPAGFGQLRAGPARAHSSQLRRALSSRGCPCPGGFPESPAALSALSAASASSSSSCGCPKLGALLLPR